MRGGKELELGPLPRARGAILWRSPGRLAPGARLAQRLRIRLEMTSHSAQNSTASTPQQMTRRGFGKSLAAGIAGLIIGGLWALREWYRSQPTPARVIARAGEIPVGGSKVFQYPTDVAPCILVRTAQASYVAYSRLCTHNSCPVFYHREENAFECPCHHGVFSVADGSVLEGPPPRPLPRILLKVRGNDILAVGIART